MAQAKKKRRTKHRGTQAGTIDARGRTSRPRSRAEARQQAMKRRQQARVERVAQPPTWIGATKKAAFAGGIFLLVVVFLSKEASPLGIASLAAMMFAIYIPMSYYFDAFLYNRRLRAEAAQREREN